MPAKKTKTRPPKPAFAPLDLELRFRTDADGDLCIVYAGTDDRTHAVGQAVVDAIAASLDCVTTEVWTGTITE